ncbi:DNA-binding domain-containing protein [Cytophaga aurantiaca]|uniref:HvfC/BufC N-terminal domain-containing protein n=1 Tax=Cytophaga aurantiaca TaxID=29530 RepID=UPI00036FF85E|nr:putative DNA-binding domain-containing protein [Cytophaga aurantiaca]
MAYIDSTQKYQRMLSNYTRTGIEAKIPGTKQEGIARYRTMIYNVVNDSLSTAYPLAKKLLTKDEWDNMVQHYFSSHACVSPYLWKMPFEFFEFVKENESELLTKYPFLSDLLLYEWVEIEVFMMEDVEVSFSKIGSIASDALVLNPSCILQYFQYPVYSKVATEITSSNQAHYFMLTHRNPETNLVRFMEVAPMFARMIELLDERPFTIEELTNQFSTESKIEISQTIKTNIESFFKKCLTKEIILGFKN